MSTESTVSQVVLQAKQEALKQGVAEQLGKWGEGEITGEEFEARRTALENEYNRWYAGFLEGHGATPAETTQVRQASAAQQAQATEVQAAKLLQDVVSGEISESQYQSKIKYLERGHTTRVDQILGGTYDRFHYGSPIAYRSEFRSPTESEIDKQGFAEAEQRSIEEGIKYTYDPLTNMLSRPPTEAEIDAYGVSEATRLASEEGFDWKYDPSTKQLTRPPTEEEIDIFGLSEAKRLTEEGGAKFTYDPDLNQLFRYETEEELDIRGFAEAEKMSIEKDIPVTYDPETNMFSWAEESELIERIDTPLKGPKEGSIGYKFKELVHSTLDPILRPPLESWDKWLTSISKPAYDISTIKQEESISLALEGKPWEGFALYGASMAAHGVGSFTTAITMLVNPIGQIKGLQSIASLTHPDYRSAFMSQVLTDPLKFSVGIGSSLLGGYTAGKLISMGLGKISEYRVNKLLAETSADDFLPYEQQYKYPQEVTVLEDQWTMFKEKVNVVDDLGGGFLDSKLVPRGSWPKKGMGYRRTGHDLIQEFIPEGVGHTETWLRPTVIKAIPRSEFIPGLSISSAALFSVSSPSNLGLFTSMIGVSSVLPPISTSKLKTETIIKQETRLDIKPQYKTWIKPVLHIESFNVNIPGLRMDVEPTETSLKEEVKTISITSPIQYLDITQIQEVSQITRQIQGQDLTTKQIIEQVPIQKLEQSITPFSGYEYQPSSTKRPSYPHVPRLRKKRKRKTKSDLLIGWEPRITPYLTSKEMTGLGENKISKQMKNYFGVKPTKNRDSKIIKEIDGQKRRKRRQKTIFSESDFKLKTSKKINIGKKKKFKWPEI